MWWDLRDTYWWNSIITFLSCVQSENRNSDTLWLDMMCIYFNFSCSLAIKLIGSLFLSCLRKCDADSSLPDLIHVYYVCICIDYFPTLTQTFLFLFFSSSFVLLHSLPSVPLSLSRTFVVSRAESLAGSPGTVAFSVYTYTHPYKLISSCRLRSQKVEQKIPFCVTKEVSMLESLFVPECNTSCIFL